jgi:nucleotide-binding universal stress UspA family protein
MMKVLVAVDGSKPSERAVRHVMAMHAGGMALRVVLANVQPEWAPARSAEDEREGKRLHARAAEKATRTAGALLQRAKIHHESRMLVGDEAKEIVKLARTQGCTAIVMGTRGRGALARVALGSVSMKVLQLAEIPVTLVK